MPGLGLLLRHRPFGRLCLATLLSLTGSEISRVGLMLFLVETAGSVRHVAWLVALKTLPGLLLAPAVGLIVDRSRNDRIMVVSDLARALLLAVVLLHPTLGVIYVVAALDSVAAAFFEPARAACLPAVVRQADLTRANGLIRGAASATLVLGPVLGAELFVRFGLAITLVLDGVSYLVSAALVVSLLPSPRLSETRSPTRNEGMWRSWTEVTAHPLVGSLALLVSLSMLCGGLWMPLAPFFVREVLGGPDRLLGWQMGAFGLGGVLGGVLAGACARRIRGLLTWCFLAEALHITAYALVPHAAASTLILLSWGATLSLIVAGSSSLLQVRLPPDQLGRAFALLQQGENAALLLAMVVAAVCAERLGAPPLFLAAGLGYAAAVALWSRSGVARELRAAA